MPELGETETVSESLDEIQNGVQEGSDISGTLDSDSEYLETEDLESEIE